MTARPTIHHNGQTVPTWHGYPQQAGAHESRPWWRRVDWGNGESGWVRTDGFAEIATGSVSAERPECLDREHPLPCPPPLCGQVWVWPERSHSTTVLDVTTKCVATLPVDYPLADWPPAGAVLVAGPGAPWGR
jgi:hypothetical protein